MSAGRFTLGDAEIARAFVRFAEIAEPFLKDENRKKLREDVLTLPSEVQAQMAKAQALISQGNALESAVKKKEDDANERLAAKEKALALREATLTAIDQRQKQAEAIEAKNKARAEELKKEAERIDAAIKAQALKDAAHAKVKQEHDKRSADLDAREAKVKSRESDAAAYEQEVSETAAQISGMLKTKLRK